MELAVIYVVESASGEYSDRTYGMTEYFTDERSAQQRVVLRTAEARRRGESCEYSYHRVEPGDAGAVDQEFLAALEGGLIPPEISAVIGDGALPTKAAELEAAMRQDVGFGSRPYYGQDNPAWDRVAAKVGWTKEFAIEAWSNWVGYGGPLAPR